MEKSIGDSNETHGTTKSKTSHSSRSMTHRYIEEQKQSEEE